jgi:hypothetical protein
MGAIGQFYVLAAFPAALGTNKKRVGEPQSPFGHLEKRQEVEIGSRQLSCILRYTSKCLPELI